MGSRASRPKEPWVFLPFVPPEEIAIDEVTGGKDRRILIKAFQGGDLPALGIQHARGKLLYGLF